MKLPRSVYLKLLRQDASAWTSKAPYARPKLLKAYEEIVIEIPCSDEK